MSWMVRTGGQVALEVRAVCHVAEVGKPCRTVPVGPRWGETGSADDGGYVSPM